MRILALDSTAKVASAALSEDGRLLGLYQTDSGRTQSEVLLPMIEHLLKTHRLTVGDIDLFAVTVGPGSFTGVRIGVATVKGLAFGRGTPCCVGVSTLRALAENLKGLRGILCPVMDARRAQVYNALFRSDGEHITRLCDDRAIGIGALLTELATFDEPIHLVGDGYALVLEKARAAGLAIGNTPPLLREENAFSCAAVAYEMYQRGEVTDDASLASVYLRLPQAERERLERLGQSPEGADVGKG